MQTFYNNFLSMGTRFEAILPGLEDGFARAVFQQVQEEVLRLDRKLSRYSPRSMVRRINTEASTAPVFLDSEFCDLLSVCFEFHDATQGAFDITVFPLLELWGFTGQSSSPPTDEQIELCLKKVGMRHLDFDPARRSIRFAEPGVQIDFGGVGKGYALQRVRQILHRCGVENALVNFGDSSILAIGQHPFGDSWRVGVQHPDFAEQTVHEWVVRNGSVSTSGASHRFVTGNGKKYGHILNPRSGHPSDPHTSISVHSSCALEAEVLSTSLTVLNPGQRKEVLKERQDPDAVEIVIDDGGGCRAWAIG